MNPEVIITRKRRDFGRFLAVEDHVARQSFLIESDASKLEQDFVELLTVDNQEQSRPEKAEIPVRESRTSNDVVFF